MPLRPATPNDKQAWNNFVLSLPYSSFLQSWQWGEVQDLLGRTHWRWLIEDNRKLTGTALVIRRDLPFGRSWLYVPRGPMVDWSQTLPAWPDFRAKLVELAEEEQAIFVRIDPAISEREQSPAARARREAMGDAFRKAEREVQPRHTLILDVTISEQELLAAMHAKTRYNVRLAERKGVHVRFTQAKEDVEIFLQLAREVQSRSGFHYHPDEYYRAIMETLGAEGMSELAIAEYAGEPVAAHMMVYAGGVASYIHGASSFAHRQVMAPAYLYWQTILRAKEKGCTKYDFFGIAPADAPAGHPWAGVTRIKSGFGGKREDYIGAYDLVLDAGLYHFFSIARRAKSLLR